MANSNGNKKSLTEIISSEEPTSFIKRIVSLPILRSDKDRVKDLSAEVYNYDDNGIADLIEHYKASDRALGQEIHEQAYQGYISELVKSNKPSLRVAEIADTYDKLAAIVEFGLDVSVVGLPASYVHRAASLVLPLASVATMYFNTIRNNTDELTKDEQNTYFAKAVLGLAILEGSEFLPIAGQVINVTDIYDLYVLAANQVIARGTSKTRFLEYFRKNHPELYTKTLAEDPLSIQTFTPDDKDIIDLAPDEFRDQSGTNAEDIMQYHGRGRIPPQA